MSNRPMSAWRMLQSLGRTLSSAELANVAVYVALSVASAFAGSLAAVCLVPLVQPGHVLVFGNGFIGAHAIVEKQIGIFVVITFAFALCRWRAASLGADLVSRCAINLRGMVHARLIDAPLASLSDTTSAEIANVLTHNVEIIVQGYSASLQLVIAAVTSMVSIGFAFWVSPPLMLATPLIAVLGIVIARAYGREQSEVSRQYVADLTRLFWHSEDFPRRLRHVRSFEKETAEKGSYGAISARLGYGYKRQLEIVASGRLLLELLATAGVAALFVLAHRWRGVDQASLIAVCLLLGRLLPYLVSTKQSFQQVRSAVPAFELWTRYMRLASDRPHSGSTYSNRFHETLRIEQIRITPPSAGLDVQNLVLVPGEMTLVSGDSGIGKSSLIDVLAGMVKPEFFKARLGTQSLDFDGYRELVRCGAYVSQQVRPWQRSVRECLLWASPDATDEMLQTVLNDVGLDRRLANSQDGLDTTLHSSSSRLSGGELQRLLLAQVILRQPFIALLDEATSALDTVAEIAVLSAVKRRLPNTILIIVSHRASVADIVDQCLSIGSDAVMVIVDKTTTLRRMTLADI